MNDTELAWAAGFFDGEGCSSVSTRSKTGTKQLFLAVTQSGDHAIVLLERFREAVQAGSVGRAHWPKGQRVEVWRWQVGGYDEAREVMSRLWPYLGPAKRLQFERCIAVMEVYKRAVADKTWSRRPKDIKSAVS